RPFAGMSYDLNDSFSGRWEAFGIGKTQTTTLNLRTYSIFGGVCLQFFNYQHDRIQLSFTYSHGLQQVQQTNVEYTLNTGTYHAVIGSRGTFFSIQLGYPIKLWTQRETGR